ncbi:hypothetical protein EW145_g2800 [Phellinidium pouzarii]|uniref:Uncharacterized protein n=1 Tax=Phellinidium pouzarii TaxID=167371 RepID=A0A4S4L9P8_9AGAM|nr:hypothetical protein EW145_g2800 [Phellinidium pouzarii]
MPSVRDGTVCVDELASDVGEAFALGVEDIEVVKRVVHKFPEHVSRSEVFDDSDEVEVFDKIEVNDELEVVEGSVPSEMIMDDPHKSVVHGDGSGIDDELLRDVADVGVTERHNIPVHTNSSVPRIDRMPSVVLLENRNQPGPTTAMISLCFIVAPQASPSLFQPSHCTRRRRPLDDVRHSLIDFVSTAISSATTASTATSSPSFHPSAQTPLSSARVGAQAASRRFLFMGFALGSLVVMSGFRPLETSSISGFFALFELRSLFFAVVVFLVLLVLAYLTNPTETSFRAFLTEQAFRHHLSRLDDVDAQDEIDSLSSASRLDILSKRSSPKHRASDTYASPPLAFANRASVSLRTPKHIFRSLGILSIAAVVPQTPLNRSSINGTQRTDGNATREDKDEEPSAYASLISDSWFIGAFGMWFWAANLDGFWRVAGLVVNAEADGTVSGILEIKALDRSNEVDRTSSSGYRILSFMLSLLFTHLKRTFLAGSPFTSNGNINHGQRPSPKLRSRERFSQQQNSHSHNHRSQTPPPLPKSASLPLHTKRSATPLTPEKSQHNPHTHLNGLSFTASSTTSPLVQPPLSSVSENRSTSATSLSLPTSSTSPPSSSPSRSPSLLFASSPLITEILRQLTASQSALADLRTQLSDFHTTSASARTVLDEQLEKQRVQKRSDDASKGELKAQTKALEDQKRAAESARRDAEKRLKLACAERDSKFALSERLEREIDELHAQMEMQGAEIVSSGVEAGALASELAEQVEERRSEIREAEEEVAQLGARVREMEEKVAGEEQRLEHACAEAEVRKKQRNQRQVQMQMEEEKKLTNGAGMNVNDGTWHVLPHLQDIQAESRTSTLERTDIFPPSPATTSMPDSSLSIAPPEGQIRPHMSSLALPIPAANISTSGSFSIFDPDLNARSRARSHSRGFAPFSDMSSPGLLSPTGESLLPSSLYKSLGMGAAIESPVSPLIPAGMDVSRSFQSDDDIILDRDWLNSRNRCAGDVGQPLAFPSRISLGTETSPASPATSSRDFETREPLGIRERLSSLNMDAQRATFPARSSVSEVSSTAMEAVPSVVPNLTRRSGWFTSSKDKDAKAREKKGLNPDAKEFSLSKDKERTFSALLSRSRGGSHSGSGSSSTPSTASLSTPDSASLVDSPSSMSASATTPAAHTHGRATSSLLSLGSSWFGSSRAFAPTPLEREQLSLGRVLGGTPNASLDRLPGLPKTSPHQKPALPHAHPTTVLPRPWDSALGLGLGMGAGAIKTSFSPFEDEPVVGSPSASSSSPTDESVGAGSDGARSSVAYEHGHDQRTRTTYSL